MNKRFNVEFGKELKPWKNDQCMTSAAPQSDWEGFRAGFLNQLTPIVKDIQIEKEIRWPIVNPWLAPNIKIKNVIFNDPATIVFWTDGTKTVVKCQDDDIFDPEKGLAMAISKKALGNKGNYCNELKKWLPNNNTTTILFNGTGLQKAIYAANRFPFVVDDLRKYKEALQKALDVSKGISDAKNKDEMAHILVDMRDCLKEALEDLIWLQNFM